MKEVTSLRFFALSLACFLLVSVVNCSPSHFRFRRDAATESIMSSSASPDSSSMSPSTPSSSSVMMSHEGHKISCDDKDNATLKTTCPNSDMCPSDMETLEKCCHCIGTCCETTILSGDSTESSTEDGKKNFTSKVKDAVNSAEGWLKNQGQNIKQGWDKAKEGIKNTATDVKDKVKKGVDSMTSKFRNRTEGNSSNGGTKMECSDKDGNCSTDMPSSMGGQMANGTPMSMTPAPGSQKNKRDLFGAGSPSLYQTHYSSFSGGRGDSDASDDSGSDEYSWSRSSKTTTGNRDSTNMRRYKREMSNKSNSKSSDNSTSSSTSTPEKSSRSKRESKSERTSSTEPSNATETSTGKNTRNKRGDDRRSDSNSNSGSLPAVKTSTATTVTEGTVTENGKSSSSSSSTSSNSRSRNRREGKDMGKNNKDDSTTQSSPGSTTGSSSNETESQENSEDEDTFHRGSKYEEYDKNQGKNNSRGKDPKLSISVHLMGPPKGNRNSRQSKVGKVSGREEKEDHRPTQYPILFSGGGGRNTNMESHEADDDVDVVMEHPPVVFPDSSEASSSQGGGGVVYSSGSASAGGIGGGSGGSYSRGGGYKGQHKTEWVMGESDRASHYESSGVDLSSYPMMIVNSESSMLTSPSGMWRHDSDRGYDNRGHGHDRQSGTRYIDDPSSQYRYERGNSTHPSVTVSDAESSQANRTLVKMDMETDRNSSSSGLSSMLDKKPGMCRPLAVGVDCVFLQAQAPQCSYDDECQGSMKCCFNTCEPYKHVGICDDSVFS